MQYMIKTEGVTRCFKTSGGDFWALKGIDIEVPKGALTILKGRSGSGKTTLLNILGALDKPTGGKVLYEDVDIAQQDEGKRTKLRRMQIGFVFQSVALLPMMTAFENVEYALRLTNYTGDRKARAIECLKLVGLAQRMDHLPQELSGGEQQRVAIARALINNPSVLFADEPSGNLDSKTKEELHNLFFTLRDKYGQTIIIVTHDPDLAKMCDRSLSMVDGQFVSE